MIGLLLKRQQLYVGYVRTDWAEHTLDHSESRLHKDTAEWEN